MTINKLKLKNGQEIKVNSHISLGALRDAQVNGYLTREFITALIKISAKGNLGGGQPNVDDLPLDDVILLDIAYLCYKNANPNGVNITDFLNLLELDINSLMTLYMELITNLIGKQGNMATDFKSVTPQPRNNNGKKKKHHR